MSERVISYAVEWQTTHKPGVWELYSTFYTDPAQAISSFEAAQKVPGVINLRCIERIVTRKEIDIEDLRKRKPNNLPYEMEMELPRECFGYSRFVGKDSK